MNFKKACGWWVLISVLFAVLTVAVKKLLPQHIFLPYLVLFAYVGVLILLLIYLVTAKKE